MTPRYLILAALIRDEMQDVDRTAQLVVGYWSRASVAGPDEDAFISATALHLHAFFTGLERTFEEIAKQVDGAVLGGAAWHAELLNQMTLDLPGLRPPVLDQATADQLDEYRRFRHRVRNVYAMNLLPERMTSLVSGLPDTVAAVLSALEGFCDFLEQLARADETGVITPPRTGTW